MRSLFRACRILGRTGVLRGALICYPLFFLPCLAVLIAVLGPQPRLLPMLVLFAVLAIAAAVLAARPDRQPDALEREPSSCPDRSGPPRPRGGGGDGADRPDEAPARGEHFDVPDVPAGLAPPVAQWTPRPLDVRLRARPPAWTTPEPQPLPPPPAPLLRTTALADLDGPTPPPNRGRLLPGTRVALASLADLEDAPTVPSIQVLRAVLALVLALPLASGCATVEPVKRTTEYQAPGVYAVTLVYPGLRVQEASLLLTTFCQGEADRLGCRSASVGSAKEEVAPPKEGSPEGTPPKETTVITGTLQCGPSTGAAAGGQP